ncbi:hypothetical protein SVAN01_07738 [Stagonosporopsis vannaccii]|nr:hypothetical protein SVAN01_07738 [Stagonosporopsis vannaccii]
MAFLRPRDPRWQGPQRWYLFIDLFKNIVLFFFTILIIVETSLYRKWYNSYFDTVEFDSEETILDFFVRIGIALLPDILSALLTWYLQSRSHFHPVYALTQSLIIFCLYPIILTFNVIVVLSDETGMTNISTWRQLCYAEMGLQAVLTVCWIGLVVCSCVAVHMGRRGRGEERMRGLMRQEMELKGLDVEGKKDSADLEGVRVSV